MLLLYYSNYMYNNYGSVKYHGRLDHLILTELPTLTL